MKLRTTQEQRDEWRRDHAANKTTIFAVAAKYLPAILDDADYAAKLERALMGHIDHEKSCLWWTTTGAHERCTCGAVERTVAAVEQGGEEQ